MPLEELAAILAKLGCPPEKSAVLAGQLDKRARQLAEHKGRSHEDALAHLLELMRQGNDVLSGWATTSSEACSK